VPGRRDEASAQVEISNTAASLLSGVGGSSAEFDAEKVARIAKQIDDGTFKVDHAAIRRQADRQRAGTADQGLALSVAFLESGRPA
jgi:anti-sigma28 factor (negative regulator of flagellin synthesis)